MIGRMAPPADLSPAQAPPPLPEPGDRPSRRRSARGGPVQDWGRALWRTVWLGAALLVLALSPRSWTPPLRLQLQRQLVRDTLPVLPGFTALAALLTLVITRIVIVTANSYGLSQYGLEMVIRILVLELLPLVAALFVALRSTIPSGAALARQRPARPGLTGLLALALPRMVSGLFAALTLAALTSVVATVLAYLAVYGPTVAGLPAFTRVFGRVFDGSMSLILVLKTLAFGLAVAVIPLASALQDRGAGGVGLEDDPRRVASLPADFASREAQALQGLVRLFAVLLLLEALSLVGNYY